MTSFEFDRDKNQVNVLKYGIDSARAQLLWDDPNLIEVQARSDDEPRSRPLEKRCSKIRAYLSNSRVCGQLLEKISKASETSAKAIQIVFTFDAEDVVKTIAKANTKRCRTAAISCRGKRPTQ